MTNKGSMWLAPMIKGMIESPIVKGSEGPMTCPICSCSHQTFDGTGIFVPDSTGTKLVCAFPSTEMLAKIDMPPNLKVGGLTSYTRYTCGCHGHRWALFTAYLVDQTMVWCVDLAANKMILNKQQACLPCHDLSSACKKGVVGVKAGKKSVKNPPADANCQLRFDLPPAKLSGKDLIKKLPATFSHMYCNWPEIDLDSKKSGGYALPKLPNKKPSPMARSYLAVGANSRNKLNSLVSWLFNLDTELGSSSQSSVYALIIWGDVLLVVVSSDKRKTMALESKEFKEAADQLKSVISLAVCVVTKRDYFVLLGDESAKSKDK